MHHVLCVLYTCSRRACKSSLNTKIAGRSKAVDFLRTHNTFQSFAMNAEQASNLNFLVKQYLTSLQKWSRD